MSAGGASAADDGVSRALSTPARWREAELTPPLHVSEIQRSRLLAAAVGVVDQFGYSDTTVTHITNRARISRRTFYELFENREDCLAAMFEHALELIATELAAAELDDLPWRERVRGGLWTILSFFDREPTLARVCVVQTLRGDQRVLERRAGILARLASAIEEGCGARARGRDVPPLTAEGLVGAAHAIVYARLLKRQHEPLTALLGNLMGMIVLPYLGPEAARREQARLVPVPAVTASDTADAMGETAQAERDPLEGIRMRVTYRTALVLQRIAERPGISNREVAEQAGISDQGQMSKLLSRLERLGLAVNTGAGHTKGVPNAWALTPTGRQVAHSILTHTHHHREAA
jgi:AcrR family transcriptional regulator/DNA-binding MarR family transcriptional regulator